MNLKVLKLEGWMHRIDLHKERYVEEIPPVCNRDGFYKLGNKTWFELGGKAYLLKHPKGFDYTLDRLNYQPLREIERDALLVLFKARLISKEQIALLQSDYVYRDLRTVRLSACKFHLKRRRDALKET